MHFLDRRWEIRGNDRGRTLPRCLEPSFQCLRQFIRFRDGFAIAADCFGQFAEIGSRIEKAAFVIAGLGGDSFRIRPLETGGSRTVGAVREYNRQERHLVVSGAPERREGRAEHEEAVSGCEDHVAIRARELGAKRRAAAPSAGGTTAAEVSTARCAAVILLDIAGITQRFIQQNRFGLENFSYLISDPTRMQLAGGGRFSTLILPPLA